MAMNPDVTDPAWRKAREKRWKPIKRELRHEYSRRVIDLYHSWFMGDQEYAYRDDLDFDAAENQFSEAARYSPFQHKDVWLEYALNSGPALCQKFTDFKNEYELKRENLVARSIAPITSFSTAFCRYSGWDAETLVECNTLLLGSSYPGPTYAIQGEEVTFPYNVNYLFCSWLHDIYCWISDSEEEGLPVSVQMTDYFFSLLDYVDPVLLQAKEAKNLRFKQQNVLVSVRSFGNFTSFHIDQMREDGREMSDKDITKREAYIKEFFTRVEMLPDDSLFKDFFLRYSKMPQVYGRAVFDGALSEAENKAIRGVMREPYLRPV
jgi:hypothetical protein